MADELYLLKVHGNHAGQHSEVGCYFHGSNLTLNLVYDNGADLIESWLNTAIDPFLDLMPTTYYIERVSARRILPSGGVEVNKQFQDGVAAGTVSGGAASNQLCPLVRLIPPMGTKSAGKFFLPCIAEGDINANVVQAGWITRLSAYMDIIMSNFGVNSIVWLAAVHSTKLGTYVDAVSYDTSPTVGFQRRRDRPR